MIYDAYMSISRRSLLALSPLVALTPLLASCSSATGSATPAITIHDFVGRDPEVSTLGLQPLTDNLLAQMGHTALSVSDLVAACAQHLHYTTVPTEGTTPQLLTLPLGGYANSVFLTEANLSDIAFFDVLNVGEGTDFDLPPAVTLASETEKAEVITRDFVSPDGAITIRARQLIFHLLAPVAKTLGVES